VGVKNHRHNAGQAFPAFGLGLELRVASFREPVKFCFTACLGGAPFGDKKIFVFEAVKRRIERALLDLQCLFRDHLHALGNRISVNWSLRDDAKDEKVECALREFEFGWDCHAYDFYLYTTMCRSARRHILEGCECEKCDAQKESGGYPARRAATRKLKLSETRSGDQFRRQEKSIARIDLRLESLE